MNELSLKYSPSEIEDKWYQHWLDKKYFKSIPDDREPFTIVIPPPNVTGVLHMGHMLNNTIQDILARKARMDGKNVCWVPGTDHASIATEAKVVGMLREKGIKKSDLSREEFMKYGWEWTEKYGGLILNQLKKLGSSCDWDREAFTLDKKRSDAVIQAFVDLYNRGKLYRGLRMVNWDCEAKTVLSNEEVIYKEEMAKLYYVKYKIENSEEYIVIATTRPETILGDTAVAVHPEDARYAHLKGKKAIVPIVGRAIPIIYDEYVDREFGTGALKVTPAHDINDYELGKKHQLDTIDVLNDDGTISKEGQYYIGLSREDARKSIVSDIEKIDQIDKIENLNHNVGRSERTNSIVEPKLSLQWFVDMKSIADPALEAVENDTVEFYPKNQKNNYRHWMVNIRDWCISRQLWWGHRIPAYYIENEIFVATTPQEALKIAQSKYPDKNLKVEDLKRDEDVLDTWFSSWLWPISVFDGFNSREELEYYYPTSILVTGWDIIFLWVARMVMAGYEWERNKPFDKVYFTGMVRDKLRRKMSKSLGNSPDALELIRQFGADGVRFGVMSSAPAGGDLLFDESLCEQGRNFCNKLWNALRLVKSWEVVDKPLTASDHCGIEWFEFQLNTKLIEIEQYFDEYRLSDMVRKLYHLVWDDFCSWYLEIIKPEYQQPIGREVLEKTFNYFEQICIMLHPAMPFITEEIYHQVRERDTEDDVTILSYPKPQPKSNELPTKVDKAIELIQKCREIRNSKGLKKRELYVIEYETKAKNSGFLYDNQITDLVIKMASLEKIEFIDTLEDKNNAVPFLACDSKFQWILEQEIDVEVELDKVIKEIEYAQGFIFSVEKKLNNEKFVSGAPANVVANEKKKLEDGIDRLKILQENREKFEKLLKKS